MEDKGIEETNSFLKLLMPKSLAASIKKTFQRAYSNWFINLPIEFFSLLVGEPLEMKGSLEILQFFTFALKKTKQS